MAFIFVPNADGGFDEGDRQTNPDTGVEYIYIDGAWRALGPKIEEEFDTLDERYVNVSGDTMHGPLTFDHGDTTDPNFLIYPNLTNVNTTAYQLNSGTFRFRSTADSGTTDRVTTHIAFGKNVDGDGSPRTYIYHLQDPEGELHAANKRYVDQAVGDINLDEALEGYLPLTGGTLSGGLTLQSSGFFYVKRTNGEEGFRIEPNGFCRTLDLFRSERDDNGPAFQARNSNILNAEIRTDGSAQFKLIKSTRDTGYALEVKPGDKTLSYMHTDGSLLLRPQQTGTDKGFSVWARGLADDNTKCAFKVQGDGRVRAGHSNAEAFMATEASDIITKKYLDENGTSNGVTLDTDQTITGKKTFGATHNSATVSMNLRGTLQINGSRGNTGQILVTRGSGGTMYWRNVVATSSSTAGSGGFFESGGQLYYVTQ